MASSEYRAMSRSTMTKSVLSRPSRDATYQFRQRQDELHVRYAESVDCV